MFGISAWKLLAFAWALVPFLNALVFARTPIAPLIEEGETGMTIRELFAEKTFWLLMLMMICSGASEQSVSQWASAFAEQGLGIDKMAGDLAGPMMFAISMGIARATYGKFGEKINLDLFMKGSTILSVASYLVISLAPIPALSLIGCAICGFAVGIMWPGTLSKASCSIPRGGTAMFALRSDSGRICFRGSRRQYEAWNIGSCHIPDSSDGMPVFEITHA